jgi:ribosomal protein L35AE/L33A
VRLKKGVYMGHAMAEIRGRVYMFRGRSRIDPRYVIVTVPGIEDPSGVSRILGRKVTWVSVKGKVHVGRVVRPWGRHGKFLVRFRKPLPGDALGTTVTILGEQGLKANTSATIDAHS